MKESVAPRRSTYLDGKLLIDGLFFQPAELLKLEAERKVILLGRLANQKYIENSSLNSAKSLNLRQQGLTGYKTIALNRIKTGIPKINKLVL